MSKENHHNIKSNMRLFLFVITNLILPILLINCEQTTEGNNGTTTSQITSPGSTETEPGLTVHISYQPSTGYGLMYAKGRFGTWSTTDLQKNPVDGYGTHIICKENDKVYIAHTEGDVNTYLSTNSSGSWTNETIFDSEGWHPSIFITPTGTLVATAQSAVNGKIYFASNQSGSWQKEELGTSNFQYLTFIAVDSNNDVNIVTKTGSNMTLFKGTTGNFNTTTIAASELEMAAVIDSNDLIHIAHRVGNDLVYRYGKTSFQSEVIKSASKPENLAIAIDSNLKVHVVYLATDSDTLVYTTNKSGIWFEEILDTSIVKAQDNTVTSVSIDSADMVHVVYTDKNNSKIKYAANTTGIWQKEEVTNGRGHAYHCISYNN